MEYGETEIRSLLQIGAPTSIVSVEVDFAAHFGAKFSAWKQVGNRSERRLLLRWFFCHAKTVPARPCSYLPAASHALEALTRVVLS